MSSTTARPRTSLLQRAESLPLLFRRSRRCINTTPAVAVAVLDDSRIDSQKEHTEGRCLTCGQQLYEPAKHKRLRLLSKKSTSARRRVPLTVPGQVERGQCIQCTRDEISLLPPTLPSVHEQKNEQKNAIYTGSFNMYGEKDGTGTLTWDNGDIYRGEFFNGNRHGHGTLTFRDGSEYVGSWECNHPHGIGTRRWNHGDCYTGQYNRGQRTGEGRFYFSNGDLYVGHWVRGVMHGEGRYYYASGQRFEGTFVDGRRWGKGKLQRTDGSIDVGVYERDVRYGVGVRWSVDRTQAWKLIDGIVKQKISIPEAVALDYDIDAAAQALERPDQNVV